MSGKLYLCPTPIGNLGDITLRTLEILKSVDLIAAEDTRVSIKLLNHFDIRKPLTSYYEHNKREKGNYILEQLLAGKTVAVISDAGMPGISDPGEDLVVLCTENDIEIEALPGPCAFVTALVASGLPAGRFAFEGFLTTNRKNRLAHLKSIKNDTRTLIFYEAPHKLRATLSDLYDEFGDRKITLARELTKKYEEFVRTTLAKAVVLYEETPPKGEFVLIIEGADEKQVQKELLSELPSAEELIRKYAAEDMRAKELTHRVADELKQPRRDIYDLYIKLKNSL